MIWWLSQADCAAIGDELPSTFPEELRKEYRSRFGRAGRGRLWPGAVPISPRNIPWPEPKHALARYLGEHCGGLLIRTEWVALLRQMPGVVTDLELNRWESRA